MTKQEKMQELYCRAEACTACSLFRGRNRLVMGRGNLDAYVLCVGEAPGKNENMTGEPFVGRAGKRLDEGLAQAGVAPEKIYICNVLKCWPPDDRDPLPGEVAACEGLLREQIRIVQPKVIVALGKFAAQTLLRTREKMTDLRGTWREYEGVPLLVVFHPAYTLYNQGKRAQFFADLQKIVEVV